METQEEKKEETREIATPIDKHKVVLKSFITGRESRDIKKIYTEGIKIRMEGQNTKSDDIDMGDLTEKTENKTIETIVISVDGIKDNKVNTILDMKSKDTDFVIDEINKITKGDDFLESSQTQKPTGEKKS